MTWQQFEDVVDEGGVGGTEDNIKQRRLVVEGLTNPMGHLTLTAAAATDNDESSHQ